MKITDRMSVPYDNWYMELVREKSVKHFEEIEDDIKKRIMMIRQRLFAMSHTKRGKQIRMTDLNYNDVDLLICETFNEVLNNEND